MSLNPRLIAIQGIGFTPIALAVMGLIELLQEEQQNRYGGSRKAATRTATKKEHAPDFTDQDIERLVTEKWEAIEKARSEKPKPSVKPAAKLSPDPVPKVEPAPVVAPLVIEIKAPLLPAMPAQAAIEAIAPDPDEALRAQAAIRAKREQQEAEFLLMLAAL